MFVPTKILALTGTAALLCGLSSHSAWAQAPFAQQTYFKASNTEAGDLFGRAIAVSGDTLVVGAPGEDSAALGVGGDQSSNAAPDSGAVYVFVKQAGVWTQAAYIKASNADPGDEFGAAVAIDGDTLVVGAPGEDSQASGVGGSQSGNLFTYSGAAYVFERQGTTWTQTAYIKSSNSQWLDGFGEAVAIQGDTLAISSPYEDGGVGGIGGNQADNSVQDSGAVYLFGRTGASWSQTAYIKAAHPDVTDFFGQSIALGGDRLAVGVVYDSSSAVGIDGNDLDNSVAFAGSCFVFTRASGPWQQEAYIKPAIASSSGNFGSAVALDGDRLLAGASGEASGLGSAYVFEHSAGSWGQTAKLEPYTSSSWLQFGLSVALKNDLVVVDSHSLWGGVGRGFVFKYVGGIWIAKGVLESAKPITAVYQGGGAMALSGTTVFTSAANEDHDAKGVDGLPTGSLLPSAGAAYTYDLSQTCGAGSYGADPGSNFGKLELVSQATSGASLDFKLSNLGGAGVGILGISLAPASISLPGALLLVDLNLSVFGSGVVTPLSVLFGNATLSLPLPTGIGGITLFCQGALPSTTEPSGFVFTNALAVEICP